MELPGLLVVVQSFTYIVSVLEVAICLTGLASVTVHSSLLEDC